MEILRRLLTLIVLLSQSKITYGVQKVLNRRDRRIKAEPNPSLLTAERRSGGVPFFATLRESMTADVDAGVRASCLELCDKHEFRETTPKFTLEDRLCSTTVYQHADTPAFVRDETSWNEAKITVKDCAKFKAEIRPCCQWIQDLKDTRLLETLCPDDGIEHCVIARAYQIKMEKHAKAALGRARGPADSRPPRAVPDDGYALSDTSECDPNTGVGCIIS